MFKIDPGLAQSILNYLAMRPYIEVKDMIDGLQKLEKIQEPKPELKEAS